MAVTGVAEIDTAMHHPFALEPSAHAGFCEQIDCSLLEHTGANSPLDVRPAALFEHYGLDAVQIEKMREQKPGWARTDDADLGAHHLEQLTLGWTGQRRRVGQHAVDERFG